MLQLQAEPAELGGEGVVDEEHVHGRHPLRRGRGQRREPLGKPGKTDVPGVPRPDQLGRGVAEGPVAGRVVEHRQGLADQRLGIDGVGQQPVLAVAEDLAVRRGVGGQHDAAGAHRFQQRPGHG